jgi:hypothetical protein
MNCLALRYGDDIIVIDAGMMFPEDELPGIDLVTPDFTYLLENREHVRALILTHGHEDHIGAVPFLLSQINLPVYGTPFTLALVERRMEEHEIDQPLRTQTVEPGDVIEIGLSASSSCTSRIPSCRPPLWPSPLRWASSFTAAISKWIPPLPITGSSICTLWPNTASVGSCSCSRTPPTPTAPAYTESEQATAPPGRHLSPG